VGLDGEVHIVLGSFCRGLWAGRRSIATAVWREPLRLSFKFHESFISPSARKEKFLSFFGGVTSPLWENVSSETD
jgi:hypothetical protein